MKLKNIFLPPLILLSASLYSANIQTLLENKKDLARSLYSDEIDLSSLGPQAIMIETQALKEQRAVLKHIIVQEIGFFNNYDMLKGIIGTYFGTGFLLASLRWFCISIESKFILSHTTIKMSPGTVHSITTIVPDRLSILAIPSACVAALSLLLLRKSFIFLHRGWYKKAKTMEKLKKIENLLTQYDNYLAVRFL